MRRISWLVIISVIINLTIFAPRIHARSGVTLVAHGIYTSGANGGTSGSQAIGTCDLLEIWVSYQDGATVTLTDSNSDTFTRKTPPNQAGGGDLALFYVKSPGATSVTFTLGGSGVFASLAWKSWTGTLTSSDPYGTINGASSGVSGSTDMQPGSISSSSGDLITTGNSPFTDTSNDTSINSGFTKTDGAGFIGSTSYPISVAYKISTGGSENPTWSIGASVTFNNAAIATFLQATGGVTPVTFFNNPISGGS